MHYSRFCQPRLSGLICALPALLLVFTVGGTLTLPALALAQTEVDTDIYQQWEEISSLRTQGEFQQAIDMLHQIITEHADAEDILRRAYNDLVFTYFLNNDANGAREQARSALTSIPDLTADPVEFPPRVNETYDDLRQQMFGSVAVTKPEKAQVLLDGELQGESPLFLDLVPVGVHDLRLVKEGHEEYDEQITVDPNGRHVFEVSMKRNRSTGWWLVRGAVVVGAGVAVAALASSGSSDGEAQTELPGPPPPP